MGLLVRMIEKQKWEKVNLVKFGYNKTPADTITSDLRTKSNTLSLWCIDKEDELPEVLLALAVGRNEITRLDVMIFDDQEISQGGLIIENTPGDSLYQDYNINHYDIVSLDYELLGNFSKLIISNLHDETKCKRFGRPEIAEILYHGFMTKKFSFDEISKKLQVDLQKVIDKKLKSVE